MKNKIIIVALLATSALIATAQDSGSTGERPGRPHRGPGPGHRPGPPLIAALDVNKDGKLDATEIANSARVLSTLDKNGDGVVSFDELRPPRPADAPEPPADAPKRPAPPFMAALDADRDGVLSGTEIANAPAALAKLDKNADGELTFDELGGPGGPHGPGGHGPGRPGGPRGPRPNAAQE